MAAPQSPFGIRTLRQGVAGTGSFDTAPSIPGLGREPLPAGGAKGAAPAPTMPAPKLPPASPAPTRMKAPMSNTEDLGPAPKAPKPAAPEVRAASIPRPGGSAGLLGTSTGAMRMARQAIRTTMRGTGAKGSKGGVKPSY